jgi:hypothetical protein
MGGNHDQVAVRESDHDIAVAVPLIVDNLAVLLLKRELNRRVRIVHVVKVERLAIEQQAHRALGQLTPHVLFTVREAQIRWQVLDARLAHRVAKLVRYGQDAIVTAQRQQAVLTPRSGRYAPRMLTQNGYFPSEKKKETCNH